MPVATSHGDPSPDHAAGAQDREETHHKGRAQAAQPFLVQESQGSRDSHERESPKGISPFTSHGIFSL